MLYTTCDDRTDTFIHQQWIISVFRAFDAFIYYEGGQSPAKYWLDFTIWAEVVVNSLTVFAQIICDGMIVSSSCTL